MAEIVSPKAVGRERKMSGHGGTPRFGRHSSSGTSGSISSCDFSGDISDDPEQSREDELQRRVKKRSSTYLHSVLELKRRFKERSNQTFRELFAERADDSASVSASEQDADLSNRSMANEQGQFGSYIFGGARDGEATAPNEEAKFESGIEFLDSMREQNMSDADPGGLHRHVAGYPCLRYSKQSTLLFWQRNHMRTILQEFELAHDEIIERLRSLNCKTNDEQLQHF